MCKTTKRLMFLIASLLFLGCKSEVPVPINDWCYSFLSETRIKFSRSKHLGDENADLRSQAWSNLFQAVNATEVNLGSQVCCHDKSLQKSDQRKRQDQAREAGYQITDFLLLNRHETPLSADKMKEIQTHLDALLMAYSGE